MDGEESEDSGEACQLACLNNLTNSSDFRKGSVRNRKYNHIHHMQYLKFVHADRTNKEDKV